MSGWEGFHSNRVLGAASRSPYAILILGVCFVFANDQATIQKSLAMFETFSKREKRLEKSGQQDVYQYEVLPQAFRVAAPTIRAVIGGCTARSGCATGKTGARMLACFELVLQIGGSDGAEAI